MARKNQKTITVYVSDEEREELREAAEHEGQNLSWFILSVALKRARRIMGRRTGSP